MKSGGTYPLYQIDKVLGIIPRKVFDHPDLDIVREDHRDQRDAVVDCEGIIDQLFPDWMFTAQDKSVKLMDIRPWGWIGN